MTTQIQSIQLIALNKLIASPRNVRKQDRKADIDALAASIAAHGLLQNLCVVPTDTGKFEVDAGGRRLAALKQLAREGAIPKDHPIPCNVVAAEQGIEVSLAENVQRVAMDAMDEVDAYAALAGEGATVDDIARRFGVTRRHVDQRLALSGLSPKIKAAWKRGDVTLDAARAFCLVEDHAQQEAVYKTLAKPISHGSVVRARLMEGRMRTSDRLVGFIGLEVYEAAGGAILRDLFEEDASYIADPALVALLAEQRLEAERERLLASGWGWVETSLSGGRGGGAHAPMRLQPDWRDLTEEEEAELVRLRGEVDALDAELDADSVEDDPRWETRDDLAARIEQVRQEARVWDRDLIARAGVVLSIDHDGDIHVTYGLVRVEDEKDVKLLQKRKMRASVGESESDSQDDPDGPNMLTPESGLPKTILRELSQARTRALRLMIARDREAALAIAVGAMLTRVLFTHELSGISVAAHPSRLDDLEDFEETRSSLLAHAPDSSEELLGWCLEQPTATLLSVLAILVASAVDLTHEKGSAGDRSRRHLADQLAGALDLDMRSYWRADADYWTRLPKSELLIAIADAPDLIDLAPAAREAAMKTYAKLKQRDLAAKAEQAFASVGYLPELLVTPAARGSLEVMGEAFAVAAE